MFKVTFSDAFLQDVKDTKEYQPDTVSILDFISERYNKDIEDVTVVYNAGEGAKLEVKPVLWSKVKPKTGEYLVYAKPKDKDTLRTALTIALVAASGGVASGIASSAGAFGASSFGSAVITAGVTMAATYLAQAIIPFEAPDTPSSARESSTLNITGTQNSIKAGAPIPYVIGTAKVTPPLAITPIREAQGNDVWLTQVFCFGYGPLKGLTEANLKIGDQALTSFSDYDLQIQDQRDTAYSLRREDPDGWTNDIVNKVTMVQGDIQDSPQSVVIKQVDGARTFTSSANAEELGVEFTFQGLVKFNDKGKRKNRSVNVELKYRKSGDTEWTGFDGSVEGTECDLVLDQYRKSFDNGYTRIGTGRNKSYTCNDSYIVLPSDYPAVAGQDIRVILNGTGKTYRVYSVDSSVTTETKGTLSGTVLKVGGWDTYTFSAGKRKPKHYGVSVQDATGYIPETIKPITITDDTSEVTYRTYKVTNVEKSSYEISVQRLTNDTTDSKIRDEFRVSNIRSIQKTDSEGNEIVPFPPQFCYVALKIKASDQLNGSIQNLNCVVSSVTEEYSEADNDFIESDSASGNCAWEYLKLLTGSANKRYINAAGSALPDNTGESWDDILDIDAFVEWSDVCDEQVLSRDGVTLEPRYKYNTVVDYETTVGELAQKIATTGRAATSMLDGKYSIIYDKPNKPAVTRLTPANTYGFSASKSFSRLPDAFRCKFVNKDKNYNVDEVIIKRNDNDVLSNDALVQDINCDGITDPDQLYRYAKYAMAQMILRPEEYKVSTGIEHKYFRRGDVVSMTHDKIQGVLHYSRVKSINGLDVELDQEFQLQSATKITFRYSGEETQDLSVYDIAAVNGSIVTINAVPAELQEADLAICGTDAESITKKYIVKNKVPKADDSCEVVMVDYADPDIFNADEGVIQDYDAGDPSIVIDQYSAPAIPELVSLVTDERALIVGQDGSLITRAGFILKEPDEVSSVRTKPSPDFIEIQWRTTGGDGVFNKQTFEYTNNFVYVSGLQDGQFYDFRVRFITDFGGVSEFLLLNDIEVIGKSSLPSDVTGFSYDQQKDGILFSWNPNTEIDVKEYEIRKGFSWDSGIKVDRLRANQKLVAPILSGSYNYFIKAIDVVSNYSENASLVDVIITNPSRPTGLSAETIDNNVNLRWAEPSSGFQIEYYNVYKETSAVAGGIQEIGYSKTTFFSKFETDAGTYTYYIEPVDVAGNVGERGSIKVDLDVPPDYVLVDSQKVSLDNGVAVNGKFFTDDPVTFDTTEITFDNTNDFSFDLQEESSMLFTVDTNKTYADFLSELNIENTFDSTDDFTFDSDQITFDSSYTLQDVVDQGYDYWMQKAYVSGGYYEIVVDYGTIIDATRVTVTDEWDVIVDGLDKEYIISKSQDGVTYDDFTGRSQFFRDFRYVKFRINLTEKIGSFKPLETLESIQFKLDLRKKYDSGNDIIDVAVDGKVVVFNQNFLDVQSITATPKGTTFKTAIYDFDNAGDQSEFTVYLFDENGNKVTGEFSWAAEGF